MGDEGRRRGGRQNQDKLAGTTRHEEWRLPPLGFLFEIGALQGFGASADSTGWNEPAQALKEIHPFEG
jgi:hypothetical protein